MKYDFIPYDRKLTELAKKLRSNATIPERIIWEECLKNSKSGYKFLRQKPLDQFIADFFCPELLLVIEIDGKSHNQRKKEDKIRTERLRNLGIEVIRYRNQKIIEDLNSVHKDLLVKLDIRAKNLTLRGKTP